MGNFPNTTYGQMPGPEIQCVSMALRNLTDSIMQLNISAIEANE